MGMEIPEHGEAQAVVREDCPRILLVGPPHVGKRSVLQRLLAMGKVRRSPISCSGILNHGWMIETKYYTAELCISIASLTDEEARKNAKDFASSNQCQALVLIFDLSNFTTFDIIQEWVKALDLQKLDILLCVGNKADRLPDHFAHNEYRKSLQKRGESSSDPHPEFWNFGIQQTDGSGLLGNADATTDQQRRCCMDWCSEHGIEYLETCALDCMFDKCISIDGDSQGVNRIFGALSAHMWPGMILKSGKGLSENLAICEDEERETDEESEISIDYERLSTGSAEPWDGDEGPWTFYESAQSCGKTEASMETTAMSQGTSQDGMVFLQQKGETSSQSEAIPQLDTMNSMTGSNATATDEVDAEQHNSMHSSDISRSNGGSESVHAFPMGEDFDRVCENGGRHEDIETKDFEQLMIEMAHMRENSRIMSDSQRREMAANLALRMASLFNEDDD